MARFFDISANDDDETAIATDQSGGTVTNDIRVIFDSTTQADKVVAAIHRAIDIAARVRG